MVIEVAALARREAVSPPSRRRLFETETFDSQLRETEPPQIELVDARRDKRLSIVFEADEASIEYPDLFQIVLERVKPQRDSVNRLRTRENFWIYAEPRKRMREAMHGQPIRTRDRGRGRPLCFAQSSLRLVLC
jgi:hypothetical protein